MSNLAKLIRNSLVDDLDKVFNEIFIVNWYIFILMIEWDSLTHYTKHGSMSLWCTVPWGNWWCWWCWWCEFEKKSSHDFLVYEYQVWKWFSNDVKWLLIEPIGPIEIKNRNPVTELLYWFYFKPPDYFINSILNHQIGHKRIRQ